MKCARKINTKRTLFQFVALIAVHRVVLELTWAILNQIELTVIWQQRLADS